MMALVERYKLYRQRGMELCHEIMRTSLEREAITGAGKLLGILHNDVLVFESEEETSKLMDFALHDYRIHGRTAVEIHRDEVGGKDDIERELLDAFLASYTSLFRVVSISPPESTLLLEDRLEERDDVTLIDIGFSQTARPGLLLFTRVVPFNDFSMTSGVAFAFRGDLERYLLSQYKRLYRKTKLESDPMRRFVAFFKLNQTLGMEVRYQS